MTHRGKPQTMDLDGISLLQALRDFETANARVMDLTQRLLRSEQQRRQLGDELERMRLKLSELEGTRAPAARRLSLRLAEAGFSTAERLAKKVLARLRKG
jgi:hypothetical protein